MIMKKNINNLWVIISSVLIVLCVWYFTYDESIEFVDENIISINKISIDLDSWKKEQIENYQFATDLNFSTWEILNVDLTASEFERELIPWVKTKMYSYNSWSIEPLVIRAHKWDKLVVNFKNDLDEETTVHWHWIRLNNSEDWVPDVTQKPVKSWDTYKYEFTVNDAWTFLFHPHANSSEQIWKWLYWILIVEDDNEENLWFDKDLTWVLKDYRVWNDWKLTQDFPNYHDDIHGWRLWNIITVNNILNYSEDVKVWDIIRLRLANISNARIYNLDLSKFDAQLIATDAGLINNPHKITSLEIAPWERYELQLKINSESSKLVLNDNYWWINNNVKVWEFNIINTENKDNKDFIKLEWNKPDWTNISYSKPDLTIDLWWVWVMWWSTWMMMWWMWSQERWWTINDWIFPDTNKSIILKKDNMYIIRMQNNTYRDHPMHLHWDFFQVISENWNPVSNIWFKDTVNVKAQSYVDVAFIPTNLWEWAYHCHILEHAEFWMFTTIKIEK